MTKKSLLAKFYLIIPFFVKYNLVMKYEVTVDYFRRESEILFFSFSTFMYTWVAQARAAVNRQKG